MKLPCAVVRDLLPLYAEKMTAEETGRLVEEHLEECEACRAALAGMGAEYVSAPPVEAAGGLAAIKREIRIRRWLASLAAALMVFVGVFAFFCRQNEMEVMPWREGLIDVVGVETRPRSQAAGAEDMHRAIPDRENDADEDTVEALVARVYGNVTGTDVTTFTDDDGMRTVIVQAWSARERRGDLTVEAGEMVFYPVPDRVIYCAEGDNVLLWGKPMNGGVDILPRLALAYYAVLAAAAALVTGAAWLIARKKKWSWVTRQLFFVPVCYILGHVLIKGMRTESFWMGQDLLHIALAAGALYGLVTLLWQIWLRRDRAAQ